jgi:hypothetical protein
MLAKKCFFIVTIILFSFGLAVADPPAVHPKTGEELIIECFRGTPDAIDGDLSDWPLGSMIPASLDVEEQLNSGQTSWDNPSDLSAQFYVLWDDELLYMGVIVEDDKLFQNKTGGNIWNADAIEVFFATTNAVAGHEEHYQYGFDFKEQTWNWCNMDSGGQSAIDYLQCAATETPTGYICEAAIEYRQMLSLDWSPGSIIGFHPVLDDMDSDGDREIQMTWTSREAHDQSLGYGYLILSDKATVPGPSSGPSPGNGKMVDGTWTNLSWRPGEFAVSHDIYIGESLEDVNDGVEGTFVGNQTDTFIIVGFPGFPYPDGLVPGTTYYWRIDEVNEAHPESPWKGKVWSFSVPPKTAYEPIPADGGDSVAVDVTLTWTSGYGAKLHTIYFGETYEEVDNATGGSPQGTLRFTPGTLKMAKTYYWRVDEFDVAETHKGAVWSFTTEGAVGTPNPANDAQDITQTPTLTWVPGVFADTYEVFFGADPAVLEKKAGGGLGEESYEPGQLEWNTTYYWRVDEANNAEPESPWTGPTWSFTTANFQIIDDMESYNDLDPADPLSKRIFNIWLDGYGDPTNGSLVGYENPPFAEQSDTHSGNQSMPFYYDNSAGKSEATLTLTSKNDWTIKGVNRLTIWYRGDADNAAETMYVVLNGTARVDNPDSEAATAARWTEWNIDLQAFADQGINLSNVTSITLGFGSVTGGTGSCLFDDIRLYPPSQ